MKLSYKNKEGYPDPTANMAIYEVDRPPRHVLEVINVLKTIASFAGYEITGRIWLKDKKTGREWR